MFGRKKLLTRKIMVEHLLRRTNYIIIPRAATNAQQVCVKLTPHKSDWLTVREKKKLLNRALIALLTNEFEIVQ